jgi:hypothetical protein
MTAQTPTDTPENSDQGGLKYQIGLWLFVLGNASTFGSAVVIPVLGLPLTWIPIAIVVGEVVALGSIPIIGMQGFKALKNKMLSIFKMPPVEELKPVSRWRHVLGLVLLIGSFIFQWAAAVFVIVGFSDTTPEDPFPEVFGIPFEHQLETFVGLMVAAEVSILVGLLLLGGLWWERLRQLFVWPGDKAQIA